jgi:hypothetical protein
MKKGITIALCALAVVLFILLAHFTPASQADEARLKGLFAAIFPPANNYLNSSGVEPPLPRIDPKDVELIGKCLAHPVFRETAQYADIYSRVPSPLKRFIPSPRVRGEFAESAAQALFRLKDKAKPAVTYLGEGISDQNLNGRARELVAECLAQLGPNASNAVPALISALDDPLIAVRRAALRALAQAGSRGEIAALKKALTGEPYWLTVEYVETIWKLDPKQADYASSVLRECLKADPSDRNAAELLARINGASQPTTR